MSQVTGTVLFDASSTRAAQAVAPARARAPLDPQTAPDAPPRPGRVRGGLGV